jgi:TonB family protein
MGPRCAASCLVNRPVFLALSILAVCFSSDLNAQRPSECDSTIIVSAELTAIMDVRVELRDWIPQNTVFHWLAVKPKARNNMDLARFLARNYPRNLRNQGVGGTVVFAVLVDTVGKFTDRRLIEPSSSTEFDEAAVEVIHKLRYDPFRIEAGCAVPAVLHVPIVFQVR